MKNHRGAGDISAAEDMLPALERDIDPKVDWGQLAKLLVDAEQATDAQERANHLAAATALAFGNPSAQALVKRTNDKLASA